MQQNFEGIFSMEYVPLSGIGLHLERNRLIKKIALKALHIVSVWMIKKRILTQKQGTHVDTIKCLTPELRFVATVTTCGRVKFVPAV